MLPSKLNTTLDVTTTLAIASLIVPGLPVPRFPIQVTDVCVVQLLVEQSATASAVVIVALVGAKSEPMSVKLAVIVATLYGDDAVTSGAMQKMNAMKHRLGRYKVGNDTIECEHTT